MDEGSLSLFDNEYFGMNKKFLLLCGLWPYATPSSKRLKRILIFSVLMIFILPHINGIRVWCGKDLPLCGENIAGFMYIGAIAVKCINTVLYEKQLKRLYQLLADKWQTANEDEEKSLLRAYAQAGKKIGTAYISYQVAAGLAFSQICMTSALLDLVHPLNESRPKLLPVKGEYMFDPLQHHLEIYLAYIAIAALTVCIFLGVDNVYVAVVHQSLGALGIVQYRLNKALNGFEENKILGFNTIISAILMHIDALQFLDVIESCYGYCYLLIVSMAGVLLSLCAIVICEQLDDPLNFLRFTMATLGVALHLFYISWPGQKVIDHSTELFLHIYKSNWYNIDERGKTLIKIMMMRCIRPCKLTTCGIYTLCFENFATIVKTTMSYFTALASLKE